MTNIIQEYAKTQTKRIFPDIRPGDTVRVHQKITEESSTKGKKGDKERIQVYEGVCIARKNRGIDSSFVVRKVSHDCSVERRFALYAPRVEKIEVVKRGIVRRSKLYYLTELRGKAARIAEKLYTKKKK